MKKTLKMVTLFGLLTMAGLASANHSTSTDQVRQCTRVQLNPRVYALSLNQGKSVDEAESDARAIKTFDQRVYATLLQKNYSSKDAAKRSYNLAYEHQSEECFQLRVQLGLIDIGN